MRAPSPVIVGVTGHRDLREDDLPYLARAVDEFFAGAAARFPDSDLLVLSGLAEGADQLVAARAHALGHPVIGLLPMPAADYEADFSSPEALAEFLASCANCVRIVELPWVVRPGDDPHDPALRQAQYALLGEEIVASSAIVLALWNGVVTGLPGGTDRVVAGAHRRRTEGALTADDTLSTYVYHIVTPRRSIYQTDGVPFRSTGFSEGDPALRSLVRQNRWNRDAKALWNAPEGERADAGPDVVARTFDIADSLAIDEQKVELRAFLWVYLLAAVATLIFGVYANLLNNADYLLAIDVAITVGAFVAYAVATSRESPDRFQDYRALAEGLRVQAAWAEAGLRGDVADHYATRHRGELDLAEDEPGGKLDWIRRTIRTARQLRDFGTAGTRDSRTRRERMELVAAGWIEAQAGYFARAAARKERSASRCRTAWRAMALAALLTTIALLICVEVPALRTFGDGPAKSDALFVIGMLGIGSALLQSYADKRAFGTLAKRYAVMQRAFASAAAIVRAELDAEFDEKIVRRIVFDLGKDALAENAEWIIAMRDRPLESVLNP